jgi:ParB family transcriptional regulator, chromosome partitioning protein
MPLVAIDRINISTNRRPLNDAKVAELMESIRVNGLLNPITLDSKLNLVAGLHRLTACKLMGYEQIEYRVLDFDDYDRTHLAEIDENLIRNELNALERSELWLERDRILGRLGLRAQSGDNQYQQKGGEMVSPLAKTTMELAKEVGYTERTFQQGKQIARDILPDVKALIKGTPVAKSPSSLLKIARAGSQDRQQADQAEQAAQRAKAQHQEHEAQKLQQIAATAREKQKEQQFVAFKSVTAEKQAKQTTKQPQPDLNLDLLSTRRSPHLEELKAIETISTQMGDEWLLGQHLVYCNDPTGHEFQERLPSHAAFAIVPPNIDWNYDYLVDTAHVVAVLRSPGKIHDFCSRCNMPFQFELLVSGVYVAICSRTTLIKPEHRINIEGIEGIVTYLINLYTEPGNFVIAPSVANGEALIICERLKRICFTGDIAPERVCQAIHRWQQWTGKKAIQT